MFLTLEYEVLKVVKIFAIKSWIGAGLAFPVICDLTRPWSSREIMIEN